MKRIISLLLIVLTLSSLLAGCNLDKLWSTTATVPNEDVFNTPSAKNHSIDTWVEEGDYVSIYCSECNELIHKGKPNYDLIFKLNEEETAYSVIAAGKEAENEVIIVPQVYNGLPVTKVKSLDPESYWGWDTMYSEDSEIKTVFIPPSVTYLGDFTLCDKLEKIYISSGVEEIEEFTFSYADQLKNIFVSVSNTSYKHENGALYTKDGTKLIKYPPKSDATAFKVPETVTEISEYALSNAKNLKSLTLPLSLKDIESCAFNGCSSLEEIIIPDSIKSIGGSAFKCCTSIKNVTIGSGVQEIGRLAFYGCQSLQKFIVDPNNQCFSEIDGHLYNKNGSMLIQYALGSNRDSFSVAIGTSIIGEYSFACAANLKEVILPETVSVIKRGAFDECMTLEVIHLPNSLRSIEEHAFDSKTKIKEVHIKSLSSWFNVKLEGLYSSPFCDSADLYVNGELIEHLEIPSYVSEIPQYAFMGCQSIKTLTISTSTRTVGQCSFFGCDSLERVEMETGVESIEGSAFYGCTSLKELNIPNSVTYIDNHAFSDCASLVSVVLPNRMCSVNNSVFSGCKALESITIPISVKDIGYNAFLYCESLKEIVYGGTVAMWNAIEKSYFYNNSCEEFTVRCNNGVITVEKWIQN